MQELLFAPRNRQIPEFRIDNRYGTGWKYATTYQFPSLGDIMRRWYSSCRLSELWARFSYFLHGHGCAGSRSVSETMRGLILDSTTINNAKLII
jgi:hypothetical protein